MATLDTPVQQSQHEAVGRTLGFDRFPPTRTVQAGHVTAAVERWTRMATVMDCGENSQRLAIDLTAPRRFRFRTIRSGADAITMLTQRLAQPPEAEGTGVEGVIRCEVE